MDAAAIKTRRDENLGFGKDWPRLPGCGASSTCASTFRVPDEYFFLTLGIGERLCNVQSRNAVQKREERRGMWGFVVAAQHHWSG